MATATGCMLEVAPEDGEQAGTAEAALLTDDDEQAAGLDEAALWEGEQLPPGVVYDGTEWTYRNGLSPQGDVEAAAYIDQGDPAPDPWFGGGQDEESGSADE
jgi:hypothetical protein